MMDVQSQKLEGSFKLTRVGVRGVKKPVLVSRPERRVTLTVTFDLYVDLPAKLKGSHMSRNLEVLSQVIDDSVREPVSSLENLGANICRELLERHDYATRSEVQMSADYFLERSTGNGSSLERYGLMASAEACRDGKTRKCIGVEVVGMTTCPCAMEAVRALRELPEDSDVEASITHNQRNVTTLSVQVPTEYRVEADELIDIVEGALSSPTYEILKRADEARVVVRAHENPKFVEDVVRDILRAVLKGYSDLPDDVWVRVTSESLESIHKHNAYAERETTMGELRA